METPDENACTLPVKIVDGEDFDQYRESDLLVIEAPVERSPGAAVATASM